MLEVNRRDSVADFAFKLRAFISVIEIKIFIRGMAGMTERIFRNGIFESVRRNRF